MNALYKSWGNLQSPLHISVKPGMQPNNLDVFSEDDYVVYGNGRSYGDVCLNPDSGLVDTKNLDRFIQYDEENNLVTCQSGMLLIELLDFLIPRNKFVKVSPGTAYVTVGGMIANDVHGKNHHVVGSFGNHVESFRLLRSDRGVITCSENENPNLFFATIGGLGLTGMILSATLSLKEINNACITTKSIATRGLSELIELFDEPDTGYEYTVAWMDLHSKNLNGIFSYGKHSEDVRDCGTIRESRKVHITAPDWLLNRYTNSLFNQLYYAKNRLTPKSRQSYQAFFYPLDKLEDWNLLYGKRGFYQYQFVVPCCDFENVFFELVKIMRRHGQMSYLTVLKKFGDIPSRGLMSFPRSGYTLAMDFPNSGDHTLKMFEEFDSIVFSAGGAIYPAKDARMSAASFAESFPNLEKFTSYWDKKFNSSFWRRVLVNHA